MYNHRQTGIGPAWLLALVALALVVLFVYGGELGRGGLLAVGTTILAVALSAWLFASMTIVVDRTHLRWYFGPGLIHKSVALEELADVEPTRSSPLFGWGIHLTPRGWLYNVWGLDAVLVRRRSGGTFLLGTDEPERLTAALRGAIGTGSTEPRRLS